jgi:hypothetical protein
MRQPGGIIRTPRAPAIHPQRTAVGGKHRFSNLINQLANSRAQQLVHQQQNQPGTLSPSPAIQNPNQLATGMPADGLTNPNATLTTADQDQQDRLNKLKQMQNSGGSIV